MHVELISGVHIVLGPLTFFHVINYTMNASSLAHIGKIPL
ncbi:hypothetical protein CHCC20335_1808 [Bacillus paralicheniformis]|nr:hypothetical protein CHCC20335_1808 [Bacillus paralicheniformis]